MRALANSMLAMLFVLALLLVLPLIAVFGIPEFVPVVASSSGADAASRRWNPEEVGIGESAGFVPHDLFASFPDDADTRRDEFAASEGRSEFDVRRSLDAEPVGRARTNAPLDGWEFDDRGRARPMADRGTAPSRAAVLAASQEPVYHTGATVPVGGPVSRSPEVPASRGASPFAREREGRPPIRSRDEVATTGGTERFRRERSSAPAARPPAPSEPRSAPVDPRRPEPRPVDTDSLDWAAAVARLRELGIRDYTLTPGPDGRDFHFSAIYAPANGRRVTHRFEAEGAEPLLAVRKVLAQIDDWSSRPR